MKSLSIYLHIPFCQKKCYYCAFNSYPWQKEAVEHFVKSLMKEIEWWGKEMQPFLFPVSTLFLGGGTPTCLTVQQLAQIMETFYQSFSLAEDAEISVEANPGTVDKEKLNLLKEYGINRLSFGVQSLDNQFLHFLGRIHTREEFLANYFLARDCGFDNINLDFISALPNQSLLHWQKTLQEAVCLQPEHISTYNLVLEKGTVLAKKYNKKQFAQADEETDLAMYEYSIDFLETQGFSHYEISNFAINGKKCRHNLVYWRNEEYLGLGPGAYSFWQKERRSNYSALEDYNQAINLGNLPLSEKEAIDFSTEMGETMMQNLRLKEGISAAYFQKRFGQSLFSVYGSVIDKLCQAGLIVFQGERLALTRAGIYLANNVLAEFLL